MHHATLCYVFDYTNPKDVKVLLAMKKRGFGEGKLNGYGGKVKPGESFKDAAIRETKEESGLDVLEMEKVAEIDFKFTNAPAAKDWDQIVHVYFTKKWSGVPCETDEMSPEWFSIKNIPYDKFWETDTYWFAEILKGKKIYGWFTFAEDNNSVKEYKLTETTSFKK